MPTSLIAGQSVCVVIGSELIACGRMSLLRKFTRPPTGMCTCVGLTPLALIVTVGSFSEGVEGLPPPQPDTTAARVNEAASAVT